MNAWTAFAVVYSGFVGGGVAAVISLVCHPHDYARAVVVMGGTQSAFLVGCALVVLACSLFAEICPRCCCCGCDAGSDGGVRDVEKGDRQRMKEWLEKNETAPEW